MTPCKKQDLTPAVGAVQRLTAEDAKDAKKFGVISLREKG